MLKGVICPDKKTKVSFQQCLLCAKDSWCGTKEWRFKFLYSQKQPPNGHYRTSSLSYLDPAREVFMRKFDYYVPINLIHIFTIGHAIHEKYQESYPSEACEVPLSAKIDDIVISGHADIFYKGILYDMKTTVSLLWLFP